jgi:mono/diheme cytochrome c family protein
MKKFLKVLGIIVLAILLILLVAVAYIKALLPNVGPAPEMTVEKTTARMERGKYLATNVMNCIDCHSKRDATKYAMPIDESTFGMGGEEFNQQMGFPGDYFAPNITPVGIGGWTDGEIYRAVTTGIRKNGKPIFPVMPYHSYRLADPEDVKSVIVFIRSLQPIQNIVPASKSDFPMNIILNTIPQKADPQTIPPASDSIASGKYLFTMAACHDCHTQLDKGKFNEAIAMSGGRAFPMPGGTVYSANITPDKETGIGGWSKEFFIQRFTSYRDSATAHRPVKPGETQTIMPWTAYANITDADLGKIYMYIQTLKPMNNSVVKFVKK